MFKLLSQPYPNGFSSWQRSLVTALGAGTFIAFFLIFFQPFNLNEWQNPNKNIYLLGFGLVTVLMLLLQWLVLPSIFKKTYSEIHWTVGKHILSNILTIALISLGNITYNFLIFGGGETSGIWGMVVATMAIGIFPTFAITYINYAHNLRKYSSFEAQIPIQSIEEKTLETNTNITFIAENEKDKIQVSVADLLYIESSDNYATIVFWKKDKLQKELIRGSLSRLESQISQNFIQRCHRSYIVNLHQVVSVSGNAQGYKLHFENTDLLVPVARKYASLVTQNFK